MNTPLIPLWLLWISGICEGLRGFFIWAGGCLFIAGIIFIIASFLYAEECGNTFKMTKSKVFILVFTAFIWIAGWFIPTQNTMYAMMVGSQLTESNIKAVGGGIQNTVDYLFEKTQSMIEALDKDDTGETNIQTDTVNENNAENVEKALYKYLKDKFEDK